MPRGFGSRAEEEVVTTPPETVGPVTVVTEEHPALSDRATIAITSKEVKGNKDLIRVRGANTDGRVALWERDERHPDGQAWVCNDGKTFDVYPTAEVLRKVKDGSLLRVNWNS